MRSSLPTLFSCVLALSITAPSVAGSIDASQAAFHVGEEQMVCGHVAQIAKQAKRTMINLGGRYPSEQIGIVVWQSDIEGFNRKFGDLAKLEGRSVCALGQIKTYKSHLQIIVKNPTLLRIDDQ